MSHTPDGLLDVPLLLRLAGDKLFTLGETCFAEGRVRQLQAAADRVTGRVQGRRSYRVKLWRSRGEFHFSCSCPAGQDDLFCKHCVAVGLAWLKTPGGGGAHADAAESPHPHAARSPDAAQTREKLAGHLHTLGRESLIRLVLEATDYDDILRRRLLLGVAGVSRDSSARAASRPAVEPDLDAYRRLLREAIETADYVDYDAMPDYVLGVQEAIAPLRGLLLDGYAMAVVELAEYALIALDKASDMIDGSDGSLNAVYDDLQRFHLDACRAARPDPELLAGRLLQYEVEGGLGVFNNSAKAYADVLGEAGLRAWRRQLFEEWSRLPAAVPANGPHRSIDHRRFQLQTLMERVAEAEGDVDALIAVKERDLASAHDYLSLAELHAAHGQTDRAILRAEEGLHLFAAGAADAAGLRDFLVRAYERAGRAEEARDLVWEAFVRSGDEAGYRRLREHFQATASDQWPACRERALAHLRERIARDAAVAGRHGRSHLPDHSLIIEILLAEHRYDSAWREALSGGCRVDLWLRLAARREKKHPADALSVYQARLEPTISAGPGAYREAIELLDKIRALLARLGRSEDFAPYRAEIRAAHRQKRGFLKLLDASER